MKAPVASSSSTRPDGSVVTRESSNAVDPDAGTRSRDVIWTGADGQTVTRSGEFTRTENGFEGSVTRTGPGGNSGGRQITGSYDPETGVFTREVRPLEPDAPDDTAEVEE